VEEGCQFVGDETSSLAVAFADDGDRAVVHVDGRVEEAGQLADAHAGGEEELGRDVGGEAGEGVRVVVDEEPAEVGVGDDAGEALRHADEAGP